MVGGLDWSPFAKKGVDVNDLSLVIITHTTAVDLLSIAILLHFYIAM